MTAPHSSIFTYCHRTKHAFEFPSCQKVQSGLPERYTLHPISKSPRMHVGDVFIILGRQVFLVWWNILIGYIDSFRSVSGFVDESQVQSQADRNYDNQAVTYEDCLEGCWITPSQDVSTVSEVGHRRGPTFLLLKI